MDPQEQAYTDIVNAHIDEIYNFAKYMLFDADEADDIVQKTFLSFYNNMAKLDMEKPVRPWLFKVARNNCLDHIKRKKATAFSSLVEDDETFDVPADLPEIEAQLDNSELLDQVKREISNLPPQYSEVMVLKYFEDMTFEQIGEVLDISPNTAKSNFYRGKTMLFKALPQTANIETV
jgi:RNA polymerase sigma-70 factor (ECF subfamily)